ncbi:MAG TPA: MerR family transcriptional regulator [Lachnospiraceae bacterium]|nr:MerR family transcriptional regulator [Lachnospiraceae bacterium]
MFRIGEFSKLTQVSIRMLRYYDEMGLLKPAMVHAESGYRLYHADQIPLLNRILFLRDTGFSITEMKEILEHFEEDSIEELLKAKEQDCLHSIELEQAKLKKIRTARKDILTKQIDIHTNITIKSIPSYSVLSLRRKVRDYFCEGSLWEELYQYIVRKRYDIKETNQTLTIYHDTEHKENEVDMEVCVVTDIKGIDDGPFTFHTTPSYERMLTFMVYGPYENIAGAYASFANWLEKSGQYKILGLSRQIGHKGAWNEPDPNNYLTEIQIPIGLIIK